MTSRLARATAAALALLVLAGCSGDPSGASSPTTSPTETGASSASPDARTTACAQAVSGLVDATQAYVDSYGPAVSGRTGRASADDLSGGLDRAKKRIESLQCDPATLRDQLQEGLYSVRARGALAEAVRAQLVAALTGTVAPATATRRLKAGEDLATVLPELAPGSTVVLPAGTVRLSKTVVLLQGVTLRGQGRGRTTLSTAAADTGVLVLTDGKVELDSLTVRHTGSKPASVVVAGPTSSLVLTDAAVTGARAGSDPATSRGGTGVLMSARSGEVADDRGTTLEVTRTRVAGNQAAGILLSGGHRASIRRSVLADNGQCGVCFLDTSRGAVRDSTLSGNGAGVAVVDRSRPLISGDTVTGGEVGVQAGNTSAPVVRDVTIRSVKRAAMIFSARARGRVGRVTCVDTPAGIVVARHALPYLGTNRCAVQPGG